MNDFEETNNNFNNKKRDSSQAKLESLVKARESKIHKKNHIEDTIHIIDNNVSDIKEDISVINNSINSLKNDILSSSDSITEDIKHVFENKNSNLENILNTLKNSRIKEENQIVHVDSFLKPSYISLNNILVPLISVPVACSSYMLYKYIKKNINYYNIVKPIQENKIQDNKVIVRDIFNKKW